MYGQFQDDVYVFAGGNLGSDHLVEAGNHDPQTNDQHDRLDFSQFIDSIEIELDEKGRQEINEGDGGNRAAELDLRLSSETAFEHVTGTPFHDEIEGNDRDNVLVGLDGHDELEGDDGNDVLIGGDGRDELEGGDDNDLLISGYTDYDQDANALNAIAAEWSSNRDYEDRADNLRDGTGPILSGANIRLTTDGADRTVFDDDDRDELDGDDDRDWFFANLDEDDLKGERSNEWIDELLD